MIFQLMELGFFDKLWFLIQQGDIFLFLNINNNWTNSILDTILPISRDANTWVPLYLFILVFLFLNFRDKAWIWILFALVNVIITDQVSSHIIKLFVQRLRPCADPFLQYQVRLMVDHCSGGFSFTSSHATNHFGFASFVFYTWGNLLNRWKYICFIWAGLIAYAQVYVGVHYPSDVICGAILGYLIGSLMSSLFLKKYGALTLTDKIPAT